MNLDYETMYKWIEHGLAVLLVIVGLLIFTGAVASPITETQNLLKVHTAATDDLKSEVTKVVRLLGVMCLSNAKNPESCIDAVVPVANTAAAVQKGLSK
jgi:ABC-type phosphate/phosphonate transport system permease subunit